MKDRIIELVYQGNEIGYLSTDKALRLIDLIESSFFELEKLEHNKKIILYAIHDDIFEYNKEENDRRLKLVKIKLNQINSFLKYNLQTLEYMVERGGYKYQQETKKSLQELRDLLYS